MKEGLPRDVLVVRGFGNGRTEGSPEGLLVDINVATFMFNETAEAASADIVSPLIADATDVPSM